MRGWCDYSEAALAADLQRWGFNPSHAKTLLRTFYLNGEPATDARKYGQRLLDRLGVELTPLQSTVATRATSQDGTQKLLITYPAGGAVEAVLMPSTRPGTAAACVSSQIGCA